MRPSLISLLAVLATVFTASLASADELAPSLSFDAELADTLDDTHLDQAFEDYVSQAAEGTRPALPLPGPTRMDCTGGADSETCVVTVVDARTISMPAAIAQP